MEFTRLEARFAGLEAGFDALITQIDRTIDARLAKHTLVIVGTNVATLITLAGVAIAIAQI